MTIASVECNGAITADDVFWSNDAEKREREQIENTKDIEDERQFRAGQPTAINEFDTAIEHALRSSFGNTEKFSTDDATERSQLRTERLEWNRQMMTMADLKTATKENVGDDVVERLGAFRVEVANVVEQIKAMEPAKATKKGGKSKGKKSKLTKPTTSISMPQDVPKLVVQCQSVEQDVPKWLYGGATDECNTMVHSLLHRALTVSNVQFRELIEWRVTVRNWDDALYEELKEQYIQFYGAVFDQMETVSKWRECVAFQVKLMEARKRTEHLVVDSVLAKLKALMAMDQMANVQRSSEEEEDDAEADVVVVGLDEVVGCWESIAFDGDSKTIISVHQRPFTLSSAHVDFIESVRQWVQQRRAAIDEQTGQTAT